jgi:uncharacterized protein (DUF433 family)
MTESRLKLPMIIDGGQAVVSTIEQNIHLGIYTYDQIAHIARLTPQCLTRWFDGTKSSDPAISKRMPVGEHRVLAFLDLVQALAIRAIRKDQKLSLQKVRETIKYAKKLGVEYPFARNHKTFLFNDDVAILLDDETLITATGKYKKHQLMRPVVELYLEDLTFDVDSGLAIEYSPLKNGGRYILMKPSLQYGAPTVMPVGYTVSALVNAVYGEGSIADAASMFEVEEADVKLALRYEDMLAGATK